MQKSDTLGNGKGSHAPNRFGRNYGNISFHVTEERPRLTEDTGKLSRANIAKTQAPANIKIIIDDLPDGAYHIVASAISVTAPRDRAIIMGTSRDAQGYIRTFIAPPGMEQGIVRLLLEEFIRSIKSLGAKTLITHIASPLALEAYVRFFRTSAPERSYRAAREESDNGETHAESAHGIVAIRT
ncbi:MAG: hypothetical protein Q8Q39_04945 [bacterium]|nr:hypothetical protein [bacterium]